MDRLSNKHQNASLCLIHLSNSEVDSLFAGFLIIDLIYILYLPVRVRVVGEEDPPLVTAHRVEGFVIQDPTIRVVDPVGVDLALKNSRQL